MVAREKQGIETRCEEYVVMYSTVDVTPLDDDGDQAYQSHAVHFTTSASPSQRPSYPYTSVHQP